MWDPMNSGVVDSCLYGNSSTDAPVPGLDIDGDYNSDMVNYTTADGAAGAIWARLAAPNAVNPCSGVSQGWSLPTSGWKKTKVFAVSDMTGDGKQDLLLLNPLTMQLKWLRSDVNYTSSGTTITIGTIHAVLL